MENDDNLTTISVPGCRVETNNEVVEYAIAAAALIVSTAWAYDRIFNK